MLYAMCQQVHVLSQILHFRVHIKLHDSASHAGMHALAEIQQYVQGACVPCCCADNTEHDAV